MTCTHYRAVEPKSAEISGPCGSNFGGDRFLKSRGANVRAAVVGRRKYVNGVGQADSGVTMNREPRLLTEKASLQGGRLGLAFGWNS